MSDPQTKVSVYQDGKLIHEQVLAPGEYVVDDKGCVSVEAVNGAKTKLQLKGEQWLVEDEGSLAGTLVDGETITVPTIILPGQKVRVGDKDILLEWASPGHTTEEVRPNVTVRHPSNEEIRDSKKYEMGKMVARGGMGVIMSAREVILGREVAMKLMIDGTKAESVARFYQEAQITAQLEHPNIVPVHELHLNEKDQPFYTMKLVRGVSLKRVLERLANHDPATERQWPLSALLTVFQKICDAIAFAHARGVIHRDLKPDNIMLGEYGEAQAMDWGLAKTLGQESATGAQPPVNAAPPAAALTGEKTTISATMSGTVIGTPQYMSPEQAEGAVELMDERTDIYSLGAILYHILTLRAPFNGHNSAEVVQNVRHGCIVPLSEAASRTRLLHLPGGRIPDSLAAVCLKAMSLRKTQRYPTVKTLQNEIEAYQNGFATNAEEAGIWKLANLFFRRHRTVSWAAALLLLAGVIFAINLARERNRARSASQQAELARQRADEQRNVAEDQLYFSEMLQAGRHLADGRPESARELLARHRTERSGRDLRNWEWFYLMGEANQDRLRVHAHTGGVFSLAVSADGTRVATGGGDGEVAIWKARGLVPEFRLRTSGAPVLAVAWHSEGRWVAAGCADGLVRIWDLSTQESVSDHRMGSGGAVRTLGWRPNDGGTPTLAFGGADKEILVWRAQDAGKFSDPDIFTTTRGGVAALQWSADGRLLTAGELNTPESIEVFDFSSRARLLSTSTTAGNDVFTVAIDPSGQYVAAGSKHLLVAVYELSTKKSVFSQALHRGFVSALAWSPDGKRLASASHDGTIRLCTPMQSKNSVQIFSGHEGEVNTLAWTKLPALPGARTETMALFSGGADGTLRAWSPRISNEFSVKHNNWIAGTKWDAAGTRLAVANFRDAIFLMDPASGLSVPINTARGNVYDVAWSPGGDRLATASRGNHCVEILDAKSGRNLGTFGLPNAYRVAWSPSGRYVAACGVGGARVWDTKTGALLVVISRPAGCIVWHPDERRIVLGGDDGAIELWDAFSGKIAATWRPATSAVASSVVSETEPPHQIFDMGWSPDARWLAFATQDSVAGILDAQSGSIVRHFSGHTSGVWRVVWNDDGRRLATAGQDGMLRVYDTQAGGQVAHINHGLGNTELHALDWSRDGRRLVSGGFDHHVRIWDARRGDRLDPVEQLALPGERPANLENLRKLARSYTELGWTHAAREAFRVAHSLAPDDASLKAAALEAEASFASALDVTSFESDSGLAQAREMIPVLTTIHDAWEAGKGEVAVQAWRELVRRPGSAEWLPLARNYLSRARWTATWFSSAVDPATDLEGWRQQAAGSESVSVPVRSLCFPYLGRGPRDLFLSPELNERGPDGKNFGMIARARVDLPAGKWRFRITGGGGARVTVNAQAVIENWSADARPELTGEYVQAATGPVEVAVEHFVRDGVNDFQFLMEPAGE